MKVKNSAIADLSVSDILSRKFDYLITKSLPIIQADHLTSKIKVNQYFGATLNSTDSNPIVLFKRNYASNPNNEVTAPVDTPEFNISGVPSYLTNLDINSNDNTNLSILSLDYGSEKNMYPIVTHGQEYHGYESNRVLSKHFLDQVSYVCGHCLNRFASRVSYDHQGYHMNEALTRSSAHTFIQRSIFGGIVTLYSAYYYLLKAQSPSATDKDIYKYMKARLRAYAAGNKCSAPMHDPSISPSDERYELYYGSDSQPVFEWIQDKFLNYHQDSELRAGATGISLTNMFMQFNNPYAVSIKNSLKLISSKTGELPMFLTSIRVNTTSHAVGLGTSTFALDRNLLNKDSHLENIINICFKHRVFPATTESFDYSFPQVNQRQPIDVHVNDIYKFLHAEHRYTNYRNRKRTTGFVVIPETVGWDYDHFNLNIYQYLAENLNTCQDTYFYFLQYMFRLIAESSNELTTDYPCNRVGSHLFSSTSNELYDNLGLVSSEISTNATSISSSTLTVEEIYLDDSYKQFKLGNESAFGKMYQSILNKLLSLLESDSDDEGIGVAFEDIAYAIDHPDEFTDPDQAEDFIRTLDEAWPDRDDYSDLNTTNLVNFLKFCKTMKDSSISKAFPGLKHLDSITKDLALNANKDVAISLISEKLKSIFVDTGPLTDAKLINDNTDLIFIKPSTLVIVVDKTYLTWLTINSHQFNRLKNMHNMSLKEVLIDDDDLFELLRIFYSNNALLAVDKLTTFSTVVASVAGFILSTVGNGISSLNKLYGNIDKYARLQLLMQNSLVVKPYSDDDTINKIILAGTKHDRSIDNIANQLLWGNSYVIDVSDMVDILQDFELNTLYHPTSPMQKWHSFMLVKGFKSEQLYEKLFLIITTNQDSLFPMWNISPYVLLSIIFGVPITNISLAEYYAFSWSDVVSSAISTLTAGFSAISQGLWASFGAATIATILPVLSHYISHSKERPVSELIKNTLIIADRLHDEIRCIVPVKALIGKPSYLLGPIITLANQLPNILLSEGVQILSGATIGSITSYTISKTRLRSQLNKINKAKLLNKDLTLSQAYDNLTIGRTIPMREFKAYVNSNGYNPKTGANILAFAAGVVANKLVAKGIEIGRNFALSVKNFASSSLDLAQSINSSFKDAVDDAIKRSSVMNDHFVSTIIEANKLDRDKNKKEIEQAILQQKTQLALQNQALSDLRDNLKIVAHDVKEQDSILNKVQVGTKETAAAIAGYAGSLASIAGALSLFKEDKALKFLTGTYPLITGMLGRILSSFNRPTNLYDLTPSFNMTESLSNQNDIINELVDWINSNSSNSNFSKNLISLNNFLLSKINNEGLYLTSLSELKSFLKTLD